VKEAAQVPAGTSIADGSFFSVEDKS